MVQFQRLCHRQNLSSLRFIDFQPTDIAQRQPAALQQQADRRCWADAHELWRDTRYRAGQQMRQHRSRRLRSAAHQGCSGTIDDRTAVACGLHPISVNGAQTR